MSHELVSYHLLVFPGFMRSTACWLHLTTQHNHHGKTPNTWVSGSGGVQPNTFIRVLYLKMVYVLFTEVFKGVEGKKQQTGGSI